jgi:hypothetical protein
MSAQFSGTSISVTLNESDAQVYYAYVIDDQPVKRFSVSAGTKAYSLATGLSNGTHKVLLMRESEGNQAGPLQFLGFSFGGTGQLMPPPEYPNKYKLEFVGDSITAGFGNLGAMPCGFSTETESAFWSYAQQTALQLGEAPGTNISISGIGIYRNYGKTIRSCYPSAMLIAATHAWSNQQGYIQAAYNQMLNNGETKVRYAEFPISDWNGCSGHPTKAADLEVANYLAQFIRNLGLESIWPQAMAPTRQAARHRYKPAPSRFKYARML